jgi:hypothetical protein
MLPRGYRSWRRTQTDNDTCFPPSTGNDDPHKALNDMGAFGGPGPCGWVTQ